ncbi:hypothetical protein F5X98DRAFT_374917 [Xylaria grammica]|nr:hypothetical protein F5X98DRAFT_374917 [Xylaria grammica]
MREILELVMFWGICGIFLIPTPHKSNLYQRCWCPGFTNLHPVHNIDGDPIPNASRLAKFMRRGFITNDSYEASFLNP